jgi:hypothetical protein
MTTNNKIVKQSLQSITAEQAKRVCGGIDYYNPFSATPSILDFNNPLHPNNQLSYNFPFSPNW